MNGTVEIKADTVVFELPTGNKVVIGSLGHESLEIHAASIPNLSLEEEEYGRDLCLLPLGWEDLSGDDRWLSHISDELRVRWSELSRKQKMAVAYTISELADELADRAIESSGY